MINEEQFDGFYVAYCPNCKQREQIPFNKEDKNIVCPICYNKIDDKNVIKKINKPIEKKVWYSVSTEFFNY